MQCQNIHSDYLTKHLKVKGLHEEEDLEEEDH